MKRILGVAVGAATLAAAWAGATAYSGHEIHQAMLAQPRDWDRSFPFVEVHELRYDKGFASATRTTTLKLGCPGQDPLMVTWRDTVRHGPLPGFSTLAAAVVESELVLDEAARAQVQQMTGSNAPPLTARTVVGLGGGVSTELSVASWSVPAPGGGTSQWQGLQAKLERPAGGVARYEINMPGWSLTDPANGVAVKLSGLTLRGEGVAMPGLLWAMAGKAQGELGALEVTGRGPDGQSPMQVRLHDIKFVGDGTLDSRQLYHARSTVTGQAQIGGAKIDGFELTASAQRLHAPSYEALVGAMFSGACSPTALQNQHEAVRQALLQLLPHNPEYALDRFTVRHAGQEASLSYALAINGVTDAEAQSALVPALVNKTTFRLDARLPVAWLQALPESQPGVDPLAMIEGLAAQGLIVRDGDALAVAVNFAQGALTLNGQPVPLPLPMPPAKP